MSDTACIWTPDDERWLEALRRDAARGSVKPSKTLKAGKPEPPPLWAKPVIRERAEEAETLARYEAASPEVRDWIDSHVAARLKGRKLPVLWADRTLRDVLLDWKSGRLEDDSDAA